MKTIKDYEYSFKHVQQRLIERHGLNITMDEYDKLNVVVVRALYTGNDRNKISKTRGYTCYNPFKNCQSYIRYSPRQSNNGVTMKLKNLRAKEK